MPREIIKLKSSKSKHIRTTTKNKKANPARIEISKYDPVAREHAIYKESK